MAEEELAVVRYSAPPGFPTQQPQRELAGGAGASLRSRESHFLTMHPAAHSWKTIVSKHSSALFLKNQSGASKQCALLALKHEPPLPCYPTIYFVLFCISRTQNQTVFSSVFKCNWHETIEDIGESGSIEQTGFAGLSRMDGK